MRKPGQKRAVWDLIPTVKTVQTQEDQNQFEKKPSTTTFNMYRKLSELRKEKLKKRMRKEQNEKSNVYCPFFVVFTKAHSIFCMPHIVALK